MLRVLSLISVLLVSKLSAATVGQLVNFIALQDQFQSKISIHEEIFNNTENYLLGQDVDLINFIRPENAQHYLNAAKYFDLQHTIKIKRSTYPIRLACLLHSKSMKTLEAFTLEPNAQFFQEVDANGQYLPTKKLELYHAGQFTLDFIPESQEIQKQIVAFAFKNMRQLSQAMQLDDEPTLIVFTGTYGAGKSYQTKHHPWMSTMKEEEKDGVLSTDRLKRLYMQLLPGVTNGQVHHETVALRKQILETYLKAFPKESLVMETVLNSQSEVESLFNVAPSDRQIKIVDLDVDLETALLRILSRDPAKGEPVPDFQAIVSAQRLVRDARKDLIERVKTDPRVTSYELHYFENGVSHLVAIKEKGVFRVIEESYFQQALQGVSQEQEDELAARLVSKNDGPQLQKVLNLSFKEALNLLSKGKL